MKLTVEVCYLPLLITIQGSRVSHLCVSSTSEAAAWAGLRGRRGNSGAAINQTRPQGRLNTARPGYPRHQPVIRHVNRQSILRGDMITLCPPLLLVFLPHATPWTSIRLERPLLTSINLFRSLVSCCLLTVTHARVYRSTFLREIVLPWYLLLSMYEEGICILLSWDD